MVLVHDDDLRRIDGIGEGAVSGNLIFSSLLFSCCQPLGSLEPEVVMDHFRRSNIEVHMVRYGESSLSTNYDLFWFTHWHAQKTCHPRVVQIPIPMSSGWLCSRSYPDFKPEASLTFSKDGQVLLHGAITDRYCTPTSTFTPCNTEPYSPSHGRIASDITCSAWLTSSTPSRRQNQTQRFPSRLASFTSRPPHFSVLKHWRPTTQRFYIQL